MTTFELLGEQKVNLIDGDLTIRDMAQQVAWRKEKKGEDDAFAIMNIDKLVDRFMEWKEKLPRITPYYAVKCNNDPVLLKVLGALGAGFDCASRAEMDMIIKDNIVSPSKIIYANPCKTRSYIQHASDLNISMMTFDNEEELSKISELHSSPKMLLRIAVSDPSAQCQLSIKYGCEPEQESVRLLKKAADLKIPIVGISFHVGSGCRDPAAFRVAITYCRKLFDAGLELGHEMRILDIGGGYPGHDSKEISFDKIVEVIKSQVDEFFPSSDHVEIIAEPGRFFASAPLSIVTNVISSVRVPASRLTGNVTDEAESAYMYYMNDGVYGSFNCILFDHYQPKGIPLFYEDGPLYPTTIWGPTCDGLDQVETSTIMRRLNVGDWLYYDNMGAYTSVAASHFNGFDTPRTFYFINKNTWDAIFNHHMGA